MEDGAEPLTAFPGWGQPKWDSAVPYLLFRPGDAPGHRRLGNQESPCDLCGGQTSHRTQGERDL